MRKPEGFFSILNDGLQLFDFGHEVCPKEHSHGPAIREYYLIHFVLEGRGIFRDEKTEFPITKNQAFLITPFTVTFYQADAINPWTYCWLGFNGRGAELILAESNLTAADPVLDFAPKCPIPSLLQEMIAVDCNRSTSYLRQKGILYTILAELLAQGQNQAARQQARYYVETAVDFMEKHYARPITIQDVVNYVGLSRSHFSKTFRDHLGRSPQQYLLTIRIKRAAALLQNTKLTVGDIARSVGYRDPFAFSKTFKAMMQMSPDKYRHTSLPAQRGPFKRSQHKVQ